MPLGHPIRRMDPDTTDRMDLESSLSSRFNTSRSAIASNSPAHVADLMGKEAPTGHPRIDSRNEEAPAWADVLEVAASKGRSGMKRQDDSLSAQLMQGCPPPLSNKPCHQNWQSVPKTHAAQNTPQKQTHTFP